jgi:stage IV sporulation protein FB
MFNASTDPRQPGTWRFNFLGFPVAVHWIFWVVAILLGHGLSANTPLRFQLLCIWVGVVFVSILVHELGHAMAFRKHGGRPRILLWSFGGLAISEGSFTRRQSIEITLAGPVFGLALGAIVWVLAKWVIPPSAFAGNIHLQYLVLNLLWVNIFWSLLNLLPIHPLDGGHLLGHIMHERKRELRAKIGMACAIGVGVGLSLYQKGDIFPLIMFGYLAYMNYQMAQRGWR